MENRKETMKSNLATRLKNAWATLKGANEASPDTLRTALIEKEREVANLKSEYARLQGVAAGDAAAATRESLKDVLKRVAPPLSQLAVTRRGGGGEWGDGTGY
jgi:hypothetical protein